MTLAGGSDKKDTSSSSMPKKSEGLAAEAPKQTVCQGMFKGLSAINLSEKLFDDIGDHHHHRIAGNALHTSSDVPQGKEQRSSGAPFADLRRFCVRPLWCLVGTFKTALNSLVTVDHAHDNLQWLQRNPRGGHQTIRVSLHAILDVINTRVVLEDEDIKERQFTVVVRTSTRPSQMVFGFRTQAEASRFKSILVQGKALASSC